MRAGLFGLTPATRTLGPAEAKAARRVTGSTQTSVAFVDFTLDGRPVRDLLTLCLGSEPDSVTDLQDAWPRSAVEQVERLLGLRDPDFLGGRTGLYGGPAYLPGDGDLAVTARIRLTETTVEWRDLALQPELSPDVTAVLDGSAPLSLRFDRVSYNRHLEGELARFRELSAGWVHPRTAERRRRRQRWLARFRTPLGGPSGRA